MEDEDWLEAVLSEDSTNTNQSKCSTYQTDEYRNLAMIAASMGVVSLVASVVVILVIFILKKYLIFVQRLILYLCIVIAINAVSIILRFSRVDYDVHNTNMNNFCSFTAFLDQTTRWAMTIAYTCLTFTLLIAVVFNSSGVKLELGYILAIFVFPVSFNWIPFIQNTYGEAGAWCWIRTNNYDYNENKELVNCTSHNLGKVLTYALWYVPNYIILAALVIVYIIVVIMLVRNSRHWKGIYSTGVDSRPERGKMKKLVMPIIFYPLVFFVLNIFPLVNRVYESFAAEPSPILWLLHSIFSPLQGGFVAILYAMDKDTIHRMSVRECWAYILHRKTRIDEYPAIRGRTDSYSNLEASGETFENITFRKYGSIVETPKSAGKQEH